MACRLVGPARERHPVRVKKQFQTVNLSRRIFASLSHCN